MKKLYYLIPVGIWIADYFIWTHAGSVGNWHTENPSAAQWWWMLTSIFSGFAVIAGIVFAIDQQQL